MITTGFIIIDSFFRYYRNNFNYNEPNTNIDTDNVSADNNKQQQNTNSLIAEKGSLIFVIISTFDLFSIYIHIKPS
jgi:hypothetical protein